MTMARELDIDAIREALDRLENCEAALVNMATLPDRIHVTSLRQSIPEIVKMLRGALPPAEWEDE
jgi:hypothetical protein